MSQTGFPNPRQAVGAGNERSPSFPLISHNKYRAPWCQLTKEQFSACVARSRLTHPGASGCTAVSEVSGWASAEDPRVATQCRSPAHRQAVEQSCPLQSAAPGTRFRWGRRSGCETLGTWQEMSGHGNG